MKPHEQPPKPGGHSGDSREFQGNRLAFLVLARSGRLGVDSFDSGGNDANVSPELEDQVVDVRRRHSTQGG
jgi:hypothetical protein